MKNHDIKKIGNTQTSRIPVVSSSETSSSNTIPSQLNHGLMVSSMAPSSSLLSGSLKSDVLLSNVHLVSTIQSPVIWPAEGILRQALMGSEKNLKGSDKLNVINQTSSPIEQSATSNTALVAISMTPQAPLITASVQQQVIMVSELGTNQIILTGPGFPNMVSGLQNLSGCSSISHMSDAATKQSEVETTRIDLEQNAPDLLVIDDHNSFSTLNISTAITSNISSNASQDQIKANFTVVQDKLYHTEKLRHNLIEIPQHSTENLPDIINQHHENIIGGGNFNQRDNNTNNSNRTTINDNHGCGEHRSYNEENHASEVEHPTADGNSELGYTADLLSQLSDTGTLPAISSSQVSSVFSALELANKSARQNLVSLDSAASNKLRKLSVKHDLHPSTPPLSPEFVKVENSFTDVAKMTPMKAFDSSNPVSQRYRVVAVNQNENEKQSLFKCVDCSFLTLKENVMENHCKKMHNHKPNNILLNGRKPIKCIGCSNIFHSKHALQVHLIQDHGVCVSEVASIVATISNYSEVEENGSNQVESASSKSGINPISTSSTTGISQGEELNLCHSRNKIILPSESVPLNSGIMVAPVQSVCVLPSSKLIMSSVNRTVSTPSLIPATCEKQSNTLPDTCTTAMSSHSSPSLSSRQSSVLSSLPNTTTISTITRSNSRIASDISTISTSTLTTSSVTVAAASTSVNCTPTSTSCAVTSAVATAPVTNTSSAATATIITSTNTAGNIPVASSLSLDTFVATTSTASSTLAPLCQIFTKCISDAFSDQRLNESTNLENETDKTQDEDLLKNETEAEDLSTEEKASLVTVNLGNSLYEDSQNKKRGRPRGSQTLRLVKTKYQTEMKPEKGIGLRCGVNGCAVRLQNEANMAYHRLCHSEKNDVVLQCPECTHISPQWNCLSSHLWKAHNIDMELYTCDKCGYKTNSHSKLVNLHNRIHGDERPFLCDLCGKGFKTPKQLRNHKAIHKGQTESVGESGRIFFCGNCGRKFSDARNLRHHIENVHNKRRPYLCSFCGYTAASRSSLRMHSRQHTGEKPFSCEVCNYTTADHNSLRRHKMKHSGNRPYQCPHCSYACIQSTTYKTHLKNKHPGLDEGLMFSCPDCPFRTIKRDNLLAHVAEHVINSNKHQKKILHNSSNPVGSILNDSSGVLPKNAIPRSHLTASNLSSDNAAALQTLVKHVSASILPVDHLEGIVSDNSQSLRQETALIKEDITLGQSHTTPDNQLPVAGLAHGEIIISDPLHIDDSETESLNGELIVPESQRR